MINTWANSNVDQMSWLKIFVRFIAVAITIHYKSTHTTMMANLRGRNNR